MTGGFYSCDEKKNLVVFKYKGSKHSNHMRMTLNSMDTYDIEFIKIWGTKFNKISEFNGIYCDQVREIFESETGLYLSLYN